MVRAGGGGGGVGVAVVPAVESGHPCCWCRCRQTHWASIYPQPDCPPIFAPAPLPSASSAGGEPQEQQAQEKPWGQQERAAVGRARPRPSRLYYVGRGSGARPR